MGYGLKGIEYAFYKAGAISVRTIHVIHHAVISGLTVYDLCIDATMAGIMPSELLSESWLRHAALVRED